MNFIFIFSEKPPDIVGIISTSDGGGSKGGGSPEWRAQFGLLVYGVASHGGSYRSPEIEKKTERGSKKKKSIKIRY